MPFSPLSDLFQSMLPRLKSALPKPSEPVKLSSSLGFLVTRLM